MLDLIKLHMLKFHCNDIRAKSEGNYIIYSDTDWLVFMTSGILMSMIGSNRAVSTFTCQAVKAQISTTTHTNKSWDNVNMNKEV